MHADLIVMENEPGKKAYRDFSVFVSGLLYQLSMTKEKGINMIDFTELDKLLLDKLRASPGSSFQDIYIGRVSEEAGKIEKGRGDKVAYRRLRDLEKDGLVYIEARRWYPR